MSPRLGWLRAELQRSHSDAALPLGLSIDQTERNFPCMEFMYGMEFIFISQVCDRE